MISVFFFFFLRVKFQTNFFHSSVWPSSISSLVPLHFLHWVVSSEYLRLLIFLFQIVIHPAWHFVWCTLHISFPSGKQREDVQMVNRNTWKRVQHYTSSEKCKLKPWDSTSHLLRWKLSKIIKDNKHWQEYGENEMYPYALVVRM